MQAGMLKIGRAIAEKDAVAACRRHYLPKAQTKILPATAILPFLADGVFHRPAVQRCEPGCEGEEFSGLY